jgi:hypothetical protein
MDTSAVRTSPPDQSRAAIGVWCLFFALLVLFNGTIPFLAGVDLRAWTASPVKSVLFAFAFYALLFLAVPLVLLKGWNTVRQPGFLIPLCAAMLAIAAWHFFHWAAAIPVLVLAYLHRRYDLSDYGLRSRGWKGDLLAVLLMGVLGLVPLLMRSAPHSLLPAAGLQAALNRLFANPASTVENLFYFGFLTEQLSRRTGGWLTPPLVGLMYTAHEMSNPEYWYGGANFVLIFVGVTIWAAIYLWRRSAVVIWLGDGLYRLVGSLF